MKDTSDKHAPFVVPEGYFEAFPAQMMALIEDYERDGERRKSVFRVHYSDRLRRLTHYAVGVAATAAFFLVFTQKAPVAPAMATAPADAHSTYVASSSADEMYDYMLLTTNDIYNYASSLE